MWRNFRQSFSDGLQIENDPLPSCIFNFCYVCHLSYGSKQNIPVKLKVKMLVENLLEKVRISTLWHVCACFTLLGQCSWTKKFFATANLKKTLSSLVAWAIRVIVYLGIWGSFLQWEIVTFKIVYAYVKKKFEIYIFDL